MRYKHTQIGHVIIWALLAIILIASGALIGSPFHREPPVIVSIILLVCLALFYKLRITIEDETLCAAFGPGIIRKMRILLHANPFAFVGGMAGAFI
jgi:hypothetical protein